MAKIQDIIDDGYQIGDAIRIQCSLGIKEGFILEFCEDRIRLRPFDSTKKPMSIKEDSIGDYEEAEVPEGASVAAAQPAVQPAAVPVPQPAVQPAAPVVAVSAPAVPAAVAEEQRKQAEELRRQAEEQRKKAEEQRKKEEEQRKAEEQRQKEKEELKRLKKEAKSQSQRAATISLETLASRMGVEQDVAKIREAENNTLIREMGQIVSLGMNFGYIKDRKTGERLWFSYSELLEAPAVHYSVGEYVVYTMSKNIQGGKAFSIHKPMKVKELVEMAERLAAAGKKTDANEVLGHIFSVVPDCYLAIQKKIEINRKPQEYNARNTPSMGNELYAKARKLNDEKNYSKAIEYYLEAIENNQRTESAIKDLGHIYIQLAKKAVDDEAHSKQIEVAREFIGTYADRLEETSTNLSFLENFYYAVKDYENFKLIARRLLEHADEELEGPRHVFLLNKLASVLIREKSIAEAKELLDKAMEIYPEGIGARRLMEIIDNVEIHSEDEIESIISIFEIEANSGGLSPFISQILDDYTDYAGVPISVKEKGTFSKRELNKVREQIDSVEGRPSDRARLLLTEAKLMRELKDEDSFRLRSVLARYCNDKAKIHTYDNSHVEVIRFYYNESFALGEKFDLLAHPVAFYLLSHVLTLEQLSKEFSKTPSVDNALERLLSRGYDIYVWYSILSMLLCSKEITANLIGKLFNGKYKDQALRALSDFGVNLDADTRDGFVKAWNKAIENRNNDYRIVIGLIKSLERISNVDELAAGLIDIEKNVKAEWMGKLDQSRLSQISGVIAPALVKYGRAVGFRYQELNYHEVSGHVDTLAKDISGAPTKLSYEVLLPLLSRIQKVLDTSFARIVEASRPEPAVVLLHNETAVDNHMVKLQIEVSIAKECSPIHNVSIAVVDSDDIRQTDPGENNPLPYRIEGGDKYIFRPTVWVSDSVLQQQAVAFDVVCKYDNAGKTEMRSVSLSLHLYNSDDFVNIDNPYAVVAESGPLAADSKMFFGQKRYISDVVDRIIASPSNQVIIYGQKRSGKSSVLRRVEKELDDKGAFCVSFSMGKIVRNISEFAFYHKILQEISDRLEILRRVMDAVPVFEIPNKKLFREEDEENPVETFTKYIRQFKRSCMATPGWETKRLVVLIDEFTYMYGAIKMGNISPTIMQQWKAVTQDEYAQFSVILVGQDVVPAFKQEPYARNAFGVIKDLRLSYLDREDAQALITSPILDDGKSRYIGAAVELIMDYTACNPYYIQIFCSYLVDYMNEKKMKSVTEADVTDVAKRLTSGIHALDKAKFENLLSARETESKNDKDGNEVDDAIRIYNDDDVELVLRTIARATETSVSANRSDIHSGLDEKTETGILKQLYDRDVLDKKDDNYKIKVRLYKEWLLNH